MFVSLNENIFELIWFVKCFSVQIAHNIQRLLFLQELSPGCAEKCPILDW